MRSARAHVATPRDNLGSGLAPNREAKDSPARGMRFMEAPPPFQPEPFRPRPYSPQLRRVEQKPSDSRDFMSFDPTNRGFTPSRSGRRVQAPQRTYDVITGQDLV